jgi:hypothetical protein
VYQAKSCGYVSKGSQDYLLDFFPADAISGSVESYKIVLMAEAN